jgi:hypothetical protein
MNNTNTVEQLRSPIQVHISLESALNLMREGYKVEYLKETNQMVIIVSNDKHALIFVVQ